MEMGTIAKILSEDFDGDMVNGDALQPCKTWRCDPNKPLMTTAHTKSRKRASEY